MPLLDDMVFFYSSLLETHKNDGGIPKMNIIFRQTINASEFSYKYFRTRHQGSFCTGFQARSERWTFTIGVANGELFIIEEPTDLDAFERDLIFLRLAA